MSSSTASPARSGWIISPWGDLAFLVATPLAILPVVTILARHWFTPEQISLVVISFASLGHHLPGFMRAYGDAELFGRFRWRFLFAPPLVFAVALGFSWWNLHGLSLVLLFWSTWHGLMQTYGFMRIYDMKRGVRDRVSATFDLALCLAIFIVGMVWSDARMFGMAEALWQTGLPPLDVETLSLIRWIVGGVTALVVVAYLVHLVWRARQSLQPADGAAGVSWVKLALVATTGWLYWTSGTISTNMLIGVAMFEIFHAVQYYAIVWIYNRRLLERSGNRFGTLGFLFQQRWTFLLLYLAAIAAFGSIGYFGRGIEQVGLQRVLLAFLATSTFLHFYYDGFIWKVRERETSQNLDIDDRGLRAATAMPALRHLAKWGVLAVLVFGLALLETSRTASQEAKRETAWLATLDGWSSELPEVQLVLANYELQQGDWSEAVARAERAVAGRPRSFLAHAALGRALLADGQAEPAIAALTRALQMQPAQPLVQADLAIALARTDRWDEARRAYQQAADASPEDPQIPLRYGLVLAEFQRFSDAIAPLREARRRKPTSIRAQAALIEALAAAELPEEASQLVVETGANDSDAPLLLLAAGKAHLKSLRWDAAVDVLQRVVVAKPQWAEGHYRLGVARLHQQQYIAARAALKSAIRLDPDHALAHFQMGNTSYLSDELTEAERHLRRAIELSPELPDAHNSLGAVLAANGRWEEALGAYRRSIELKPDHGAWHYNLGLLLLELGDRGGSRAHVLQAQRLGVPPSPDVLSELGL